MSLITLRCPQCNADLEIDSEREYMYCEYCGTKVMRDRHTTINNNVTNNVTYADGHAVHTADWYYENWQGLLKRKRWDDADELFDEFKHEYPLDPRVEEELHERVLDEWRPWINILKLLGVFVVLMIIVAIIARLG